MLIVEKDKVVIVHSPTGYEVGQSGKEDYYLHDCLSKEFKFYTKYGITTPPPLFFFFLPFTASSISGQNPYVNPPSFYYDAHTFL